MGGVEVAQHARRLAALNQAALAIAGDLDLLQAFLDEPLLERTYREAVAARYLWHEFGDLCLIL